MKTIIFCRVSSKEQEVEGFSLAAQEKLLTEYAEGHTLEIAKVFTLSETASGEKQRENFDKMLEYTRKHNIPSIVCEKVDRLTRNLKDAVSMNEWLKENFERQVHFVKENVVLNNESKSNEKFIWNIKISVAQYYIDNLSEEVRKGQAQKIREGWLPTKPPTGYKTIGEQGHKIHVLDEQKAPLVKRMFELYATGEVSLKRLTERMADEGLRGYTNGKLGKSRIHQLLTDIFYIGKMRWNNEVYEGKHEALIDAELFQKVQTTLKSKTTPKYRKHFFLLQGLIKCAGCQGKITWEIQKGIVYGHCNHYRACEQKTWAKEKEVEEQLGQAFDKLQIKNARLIDWIRKALKEAHKEETSYNDTAISELNKSLERIQRRMDNLYQDKLDEVITRMKYDSLFKQFTEEKNGITQAIQKHSQASTKYQELGVSLYELSQKAKELYLRAERDDKRKLLSLVFDNLTLDEGALGFDFTTPFKLLSEVVNEVKSSKVEKQAVLQARIFEPTKKLDLTTQSSSLYLYLKTKLPRVDSNHEPFA